MPEGYFSAERDNAIIEAGGFFCWACSVGKPLDDISPNSRYCVGCYGFLAKEAELLSRGKRPAWLLKASGAKIAPKSLYQGVRHGAGIMSPIKDQKTKVDIVSPPVAKVTHGKRGPKRRELPEDLVMQLAAKGMGSKAIAAQLRAERSLTVSYKTIQRVLSGQRVMIC